MVSDKQFCLLFHSLCSKCPPSCWMHDLRRRRHWLIAQSMIFWSNFCHSSTRRVLRWLTSRSVCDTLAAPVRSTRDSPPDSDQGCSVAITIVVCNPVPLEKVKQRVSCARCAGALSCWNMTWQWRQHNRDYWMAVCCMYRYLKNDTSSKFDFFIYMYGSYFNVKFCVFDSN